MGTNNIDKKTFEYFDVNTVNTMFGLLDTEDKVVDVVDFNNDKKLRGASGKLFKSVDGSYFNLIYKFLPVTNAEFDKIKKDTETVYNIMNNGVEDKNSIKTFIITRMPILESKNEGLLIFDNKYSIYQFSLHDISLAFDFEKIKVKIDEAIINWDFGDSFTSMFKFFSAADLNDNIKCLSGVDLKIDEIVDFDFTEIGVNRSHILVKSENGDYFIVRMFRGEINDKISEYEAGVLEKVKNKFDSISSEINLFLFGMDGIFKEFAK